jgi:hypothetical protein
MSKSTVALAACCLALSACGGGSDEDQVKSAATDFAHAFASGDTDKACDLLTDSAQKQIETAGKQIGGGDCAKVMKAVRRLIDKKDLDEIRQFKVVSVKVDGDTAEVEDNGSNGDPTRMRKVSGEWKVDGDITN